MCFPSGRTPRVGQGALWALPTVLVARISSSMSGLQGHRYCSYSSPSNPQHLAMVAPAWYDSDTDTPSPSVSHRPMVSGISIRYALVVRPLMRAMGVLSIESLPALEFRHLKPLPWNGTHSVKKTACFGRLLGDSVLSHPRSQQQPYKQ